MDNIIGVTMTQYNSTDNSFPLRFNVTANTEIISNTEEYTVCIRSLEIPINSAKMPINISNNDFVVGIFNEYKPEDFIIPGLPFGWSTFTIPGTIMSVQDFLRDLNQIVFKKAMPKYLGEFILDEENHISYVYNEESASDHNMIKIYFGSRLQRLLPFNYSSIDTMSGMKRFLAVTNYTNTPNTKITSIKADKYTFPLFYNLKSIRVYTTLPITRHKIYSMGEGSLKESDLLASVAYNSMQMHENSNLLYLPSTFVYSSMGNLSQLRQFDVTFSYFYGDGSEIAIQLEPFDYASISISFEKK